MYSQKAVSDAVEKFLSEHDLAELFTIWKEKYEPELQQQSSQVVQKGKKKSKVKSDVKRPVSAYILFCNEFRNAIKDEMEKNGEFEDSKNKNTLVTKRLAERWNHIKQSDLDSDKECLNRFTTLSKQNREQYQSDKTSTTDSTQKKKTTAYMLFCTRFRNDIKAILGPKATQKEIMSELGRKWTKLKESTDESDKELFESFREQSSNSQ